MTVWIALAVALAAVLALSIRARSAPARASPRSATAFIAVILPLGVVAIYLLLGAPGLPSGLLPQSKQARQTAADTTVKEIEAQIAAAPKDATLWLGLARALRDASRYEESAKAFGKAIALGRSQPAVRAMRAEMLVLSNDGKVSPETRKIFEKTLAEDPSEPRARYYIGLAELQGGAAERALGIWLDLEAESAADAPWMATLKSRMRMAAEQHGLDLEALRTALRTSRAGPAGNALIDKKKPGSGGEAETFGEKTPEHIAAEQLAAQLAEAPRDLAGWRRLGRAWQSLGENDKAAQAFSEAAELASDNSEVLVEYGRAMVLAQGGDSPDQQLHPAIVNVMIRVLDLDAKNTTALWYLGLAELQIGSKIEARKYWDQLLAVLPDDDPKRAEFARRIATLETLTK